MAHQEPDAAPLGLNEKSSKKTWILGQKILAFLVFIGIIVLGFTLMATNAENVSQKREESRQESRSAGFANSTMLEDELFAAASRAAPVADPIQLSLDASPAAQSKTQIILVRPPSAKKTPAKKIRVITDSERELARRYRDMKNNAILSKSGVEGFTERDSGTGTAGQQMTASNFIPPNNPPQYDQLSPEAMQTLMQGMQKDANGQSQKLDFLLKDAAGRTPQGYSDNTRVPQVARLELKAGTVIPGLLITGLNSDLPGSVIGQVSENVYDTATGNFLLIPQGARVLGAYDSKITYGQKRIGIVWNRIIFPDGSSLNISGSPGTDLAGFSGIKGKVDNHYGQLFTAALFTSVFAGAADIATGGRNSNNNNNDKKSVRDVIVETVGAEIAEIGVKMADRALDIQPTVKINPGQRFNVMVQQDVVFLQAWDSKGSSVAGF
jgi:type IV secretory pathway VirB10-like protein